MSKMSSVVHFEMPYDDRERMAKFYQNAFGWQTQMFGEEMGNYVLATTTETDEGRPTKPGAINGGFFPKRPDWPAQYPNIVIAVDDVQVAMRQVTEAGGNVLGEPMLIPGVGQYVSFFDTEGNRVSMLQPIPHNCMRRSRYREDRMAAGQRITPCLWFDSEAEEAAGRVYRIAAD